MGSSYFITNLDGEIAEHLEYVPFGEVFIEERNGSFSTPYLYNGKELDPETGYYYYGARYYNPRVSQWLSVDPLAEKMPSWLPYAYTFNNPIRFVDPTGLEGEDPPGSKNPRKPESRPEGMSEEEGLSYIVVIDGKKYHQYTDNLFAKIGNVINSWFGGDDDYFVEKKPYNRADDRFIHELVNQSAGALVGGVIAKGISSVSSPLLGKLLSKSQINEYAKIGSTGKVGEDALKLLGGKSQQTFETTLGRRVVDQVTANGIINESKVGYTSLTSAVRKQIAKDAEIMTKEGVRGSVWHFFKSPKTGKVGASKPLLQELEKNNIQYIIYK